MIHWQVINKVMSTTGRRGLLFHALRARNIELTDEQLLNMINDATVRMTPQVGLLIHSNLEIQMNRGNIQHYVFLYSGRDGQLIKASHLNGRGQWDDCPIIQPHKKAG